MTKAQILDQIIEKKQEELVILDEAYSKVDTKRAEKYFGIIQKYFGEEFTLDDVYFKHDYGTSYELKRPHPQYDYDKELMTIRVRDDWKTGEFSKIETSMYSTNDDSQFELERIFTAGEVAKVLLDFGDDIVAEFNTVKEKIAKEHDEARTAKWTCEADIQKLKSEKNQTFLDKADTLLNGEGLVFDKDKKGTIDLRWDWTLRGITSAKIISKTTSGKSADIEISTWDNPPRVYEKVRMSNIDALKWQYRDYVIKA